MLKAEPEDFMVEEICEDETVLGIGKKVERNGNGRFTHFVLQKKNWSTADAIKAIAEILHVSHTRFNFSGTKDKKALTTQLVSVFDIAPEKLLSLKIKDIQINGAWAANEKVRLGSLIGNRFEIRVSEPKRDGKTVKNIYKELGGKFPNYFGGQRFGTTRKNTDTVGKLILGGKFGDAVMDYLTNSNGEENENAKIARKELEEKKDFARAIEYFPKHLRMERIMLGYLAKSPSDFKGALKRLPRNILLLFVHAFQSRLFNELLSQRIAEKSFECEDGEYFCGENSHGFPDINAKPGTRDSKRRWLAMKIIGYETFDLSEREHEILEKYEIMPSAFRIKEIPEISTRGTYRTIFAPFKDFAFNDGVFKFSIPSGSYATVALREFLDVEKRGKI